MKKKLLNQLFAAALVCGSLLAVGNVPASAADNGIKFGMKTENGNVYFYDQDKYDQDKEVKQSNNWVFYHIKNVEGMKDFDGWYHSDANGMMQKNVTIKDDKGNDCVLNADGKLTNRKAPEFNESKETESKEIESEVDVKGHVTYNRKTIDGKIYYVDNINGEKKIGWVMDDTTKKWHYCDKDGVMLKDTTITDNNQKFVLDADGAWNN